jgi:hypothetical protein
MPEALDWQAVLIWLGQTERDGKACECQTMPADIRQRDLPMPA